MTKWTAVLSMLALGAVACDDATGTTKPAQKDAGGIDSGLSGVKYGDCSEDEARKEVGAVGQQWEGAPPWSPSDLSACDALCPKQQFSCIEEKCNRGKEFVDCYIGEIAYCGGDTEDAECPEDYRIFGCCLIANKCFDVNSQDQFDTCLQEKCLEDFQSFFDCAQSRCQQAAVVSCVGGTTDTDAGTKKSAFEGNKSLLQRAGAMWARHYAELKALQK